MRPFRLSRTKFIAAFSLSREASRVENKSLFLTKATMNFVRERRNGRKRYSHDLNIRNSRFIAIFLRISTKWNMDKSIVRPAIELSTHLAKQWADWYEKSWEYIFPPSFRCPNLKLRWIIKSVYNFGHLSYLETPSVQWKVSEGKKGFEKKIVSWWICYLYRCDYLKLFRHFAFYF